MKKLEKKPLDLPIYWVDSLKYSTADKKLFWFQKFKGRKWVYGQNFGDYLSLVIVGELLRQKGYSKIKESNHCKLLALGSILHFASTNDVVWGSGINGKVGEEEYKFEQLDVRMVRGPKTKKVLEEKGVSVASTSYGDPALLLSWLFPNLNYRPKAGKKIVLPNLNEMFKIGEAVPKGFKLISPIGYWRGIVSEILSSELVITSSLHGLIISELFGVPVRFVSPCGGETLFKYEDYLEGTGRSLDQVPGNLLQGITENSGVSFSKPIFNVEGMIEAFPFDIFSK